MAERIVRTGIGTFLRPDGVWDYAHLGSTVDVHDDDLERFDRLNPSATEVADAAGDAYPEGDPSDDWKVDQLKAYARDHDVDLDGATRKDDVLAAITAAADDTDGDTGK